MMKARKMKGTNTRNVMKTVCLKLNIKDLFQKMYVFGIVYSTEDYKILEKCPRRDRSPYVTRVHCRDIIIHAVYVISTGARNRPFPSSKNPHS